MIKKFEEFIDESTQLHGDTNCTDEQYEALVIALKEWGEKADAYNTDNQIVFDMPDEHEIRYSRKDYGKIYSDDLVCVVYDIEYDEVHIEGRRFGANLNNEFVACDWDDLIDIIRRETKNI